MPEGSSGRRPLRICHLAYTFYENDNRVIRYAESYAEQGDEVDVIALRRHGQEKEGVLSGVNVSRIQRRSVTEKRALDYLLKILWFLVQATAILALRQIRRRYDIIHVHNVPDFLVFAAIVPRLAGTRVILDIHDILPELYAGKFGPGEQSALFRAMLAIERLSCRFADHVIVANHLWYDKLTQRSVPAPKCTAIINYPDLNLFVPAPREGKRHDGSFVVLYPGTLNHHQGLDIAVRAFAQASDRMPGSEFHIYGEGPARPELEALVATLKVQDRVLIKNRVPFKEIASLMATADLGVVPKRADGFGNEAFSTKILEFMASGVPVIVSRTQVDAYYFNASVVRFFTPGDEADLAEALVWSYRHRTEHGEWIRNAREFAVRNSWQERVVDYRGIIDALVGPSSRPAPVAG